MNLEGKNVAILIAPKGTEDSEFSQPKEALEAAGAIVTVVGIKTGKAQTVISDLEPANEYDVDLSIADAKSKAFDGLVVPGGSVGSDKLRADEGAVSFVRSFVEASKPVAVICHGPWILIEAGAAKNRQLTSYLSLKTDIENAGGKWIDQKVVTDAGVTTSRSPDDLPAFISRFKDQLAG